MQFLPQSCRRELEKLVAVVLLMPGIGAHGSALAGQQRVVIYSTHNWLRENFQQLL